MKIIFLDIDGVLNSHEWYVLFNVKHNRPPKSSMTNPEEQIDPLTLHCLNNLIEKSNANIVISSTWRIIHKISEIREILYKCGLIKDAKIIGYTPDYDLNKQRGEEIQEWLNRTNKKIESFVILDDDSDMGNLTKYLVQTDHQCGLVPADVEKALEILNVSNNG